MTATEIIEAKGGPSAVAAVLSLKPGSVRGWKHRNRIPRSVWPEIIEAYPDLTLEALKAAEATGAPS